MATIGFSVGSSWKNHNEFTPDVVPIVSLDPDKVDNVWLWPPGKSGGARGRGRGRGSGRSGNRGRGAAARTTPAAAGAHDPEDAAGGGAEQLDGNSNCDVEEIDDLDEAPAEDNDDDDDDADGGHDGLALLIEAQDELHEVAHRSAADVIPPATPPRDNAGDLARDDGGDGLLQGPLPRADDGTESMPSAPAQAHSDADAEAAPDPPPPPSPREGHPGGLRVGYDVLWESDEGTIAHYPAFSAFVATCHNPLHGRCMLQRVSAFGKSKEQRSRTRGGRPLGFMLCWLQSHTLCRDKDEHWRFRDLPLSQTNRLHCRNRLKAQGSDLFRHERELRPGEPEEPADLRAYM